MSSTEAAARNAGVVQIGFDNRIFRIYAQSATDFALLFGGLDNRIHAIVTFLALLELLNMQLIEIIQGEGINNFWLMLPSIEDEENDENLMAEIVLN